LGDAAPNCSKNFVVLYGCKGQPDVRLAQCLQKPMGRKLVLNCGVQSQPVSN